MFLFVVKLYTSQKVSECRCSDPFDAVCRTNLRSGDGKKISLSILI